MIRANDQNPPPTPGDDPTPQAAAGDEPKTKVMTAPEAQPRSTPAGEAAAGEERAKAKSAAEGDGEEASPRRKERRRRHWGRRIVVGLLLLLILIIVGIQIVLMTDLPRQIMLSALSKTLGLKAEASAVHAGWFSDTTVTDVKLTVPLEDAPFLETKSISVKHNNLLSIVLFGIELKHVVITDPAIHLRQSSSGRWNVADALGQMGVGGQPAPAPGAPAAKPERPVLPALDILNARVDLTDRDGVTNKVGPVNILGRPDVTNPELVWGFDINTPGQFYVVGRLAVGPEWRHEAKVDVTDLRPLVAPFAPTAPNVKLTGHWEGRAGDGVVGRLSIDELTVNDGLRVRGAVAVEQGGGKTTVRPQSIELFPPPGNPTTVPATKPIKDRKAKPQLVVDGGAVVFENGVLRTENLTLRGGGGVAAVDAQYTTAAKTGTLDARWTELAVPAGVVHTGKLHVDLGQTLGGNVKITGRVDTKGRLGEATPAPGAVVSGAATATAAPGAKPVTRGWDGHIDLDVGGPTYADLTARVTFPQFAVFSDRQRVPFDGLAIQLAVSEKLGNRPGGDLQRRHPGTGVSLESVTLGTTERLAATGFYLPKSEEWALKATGTKFPLPMVDADALAIALDLSGDAERIRISQVKVGVSDTVVTVVGGYVYDSPNPLGVSVVVEHTPPTTTAEVRAMGVEPLPKPIVVGQAVANLELSGVLKGKRDLKLNGQLQGIQVVAAGRDVGNVSIDVEGAVDDHVARLWRSADKPYLELLGGKWDLAVHHDFDQSATRVDVAVNDWDLKEVGEVAGQTKLSGTAEGKWAFYLPGGGDPARRVRGGGQLIARKVVASGVEIDALGISLALENGKVSVPVEARRHAGVATLTLGASVDDPKTFEATDLKIGNWPVTLPPATSLTINGTGPFVAVMLPDPKSDVPARRKLHFKSGPIKVATDIKVKDFDAGELTAHVMVEDRRAHLLLLQGKLFGSTLEAKASVDLDNPNAATATFALRDVDPTKMLELVPSLKGLTGRFDLFATVTPDTNPYALEPLVADVTFDGQALLYRQPDKEGKLQEIGIRVGDGRFRALMRMGTDWGLERLVLADQAGVYKPLTQGRAASRLPPNTLEVCGGRLVFWGRMTLNRNDRGRANFDTRTVHGRVALQAMDLTQVMQAAKPDGKPTPGLIDGEVIVYGTTRIDEALESAKSLDAVRAAAAAAAATTQPTTVLDKTIASLQGEGRFTLENSDIGNVQVISGLYNLLRLGSDVRKPTGAGSGSFRIENNALYLTAFRYFNRGVEVRAVSEVKNLHLQRDASLSGTAYGSIRTLKDVQVPLLRSVIPDLDEIVAAIQQNGVSVKIDGTIEKPVVTPILLGDLGRSLKELLFGDYQDARNLKGPDGK